MLPETEENIEQLAKRYFVDELGLTPEDVPEASRNLLAAFEVLLRVDNRLKQQPV